MRLHYRLLDFRTTIAQAGRRLILARRRTRRKEAPEGTPLMPHSFGAPMRRALLAMLCRAFGEE